MERKLTSLFRRALEDAERLISIDTELEQAAKEPN